MRIADVYPSRYLKASDLDDPTRARVTAITTELFGEKKEPKFVFTLTGQTKPFVCNVTSARTMEELTGSDDADDWIGTEVMLKPTKVSMSGKMVDSILLSRAPVVRPAKKAVDAAPDTADQDIGF